MWSHIEETGKFLGIMPPFNGQRKAQRTGAKEINTVTVKEAERVGTERPHISHKDELRMRKEQPM